MKFKIVENGQEKECEIIFTFKDKSSNISYIVYTDGTKDENGVDEIYASRYVLNNGNYELQDIENDYEWDLLDNELEKRFMEMDD